MMVLFEVLVAPSSGNEPLLTDEVMRDTQAQIMTPDEARAVGFQGLPEAAGGQEMRYIAVAKRDAAWVHRALEASNRVARFRMFDVD